MRVVKSGGEVMQGWKLREGVLVQDKVSEDEFWSLFNYVFSDACHKTITYKFGLIKSICDQIYDWYEEQGIFLSHERIFLNKYHLKQMS